MVGSTWYTDSPRPMKPCEAGGRRNQALVSLGEDRPGPASLWQKFFIHVMRGQKRERKGGQHTAADDNFSSKAVKTWYNDTLQLSSQVAFPFSIAFGWKQAFSLHYMKLLTAYILSAIIINSAGHVLVSRPECGQSPSWAKLGGMTWPLVTRHPISRTMCCQKVLRSGRDFCWRPGSKGKGKVMPCFGVFSFYTQALRFG